ncbi:MAG: hypothetical protein GC192_16990 [Bacteroidetes bacterium]|nr:hypothetical protein [Bacteroidota bacterium]
MEEKFPKSDKELLELLKKRREKEEERRNRNLKSQLEKVLRIVLKPFLSQAEIENRINRLNQKYDSLYMQYQSESRVISQVWFEVRILFEKALLPPSPDSRTPPLNQIDNDFSIKPDKENPNSKS